MFSVGDGAGHFAGEADQLAGAGIGHDGDGLLRCAAGQCAAVLEDEAAGAALERSSDALDGDVAGGAFDVGAGGKHLALTGAFEIAVELLIDSHPGEGRAFGFVFGWLRDQLYFEGSAGV